MKILYFTTTGNSLFIAKQFKGAELVSIPQIIKHKEYDIEDDVVGIIFPVYVYTSPKLVNYFIDQVNIKAKYIFIIGTYGSSSGLFYQQIEKKLLKKNIKTNYVNKVLMVDNAVHVGFDMKKQKKKKALKLIDEEIKRIKQDIEKRMNQENSTHWILGYFWFGVLCGVWDIDTLIQKALDLQSANYVDERRLERFCNRMMDYISVLQKANGIKPENEKLINEYLEILERQKYERRKKDIFDW